ncbi:MAG TPA: glutathione S-transferase family protein [Steroidobacteraceae bacterium]|nr:glutathione S-transferase family protein [Steroidobacteraceae bacterium]
MSALTLVIGTRNYSSWSLRPWLLLRHLGLPFSERLFELDSAEFASEVPKISPTGRVPALIHGGLRIWESLTICEYASELAGGRGWPADAARRAEARAIATEMHAGFLALRSACPMNARATGRRVALTPPLMQDLRRIDAIWSSCRRDHGDRGPYLYGDFSTADAMFAPVVLRIRTYALPLSGLATHYYDHMLADPQLREWISAAERETTVIPHDEAGAGA